MSITATSLPDTCTIQRRHAMQKLTYTGGAGAAVAGQTVTGGTSHATAIIERLETGYLVVSAVVGVFSAGETITTPTWSGTLGTQTDFANDSGEAEWYWSDDQLAVPCRFYSPRPGSAPTLDYGEGPEVARKVMINPTATVNAAPANEYRIVSTVTGFAGTFAFAAPPEPRKFTFGLHHWEILLRKVKV